MRVKTASCMMCGSVTACGCAGTFTCYWCGDEDAQITVSNGFFCTSCVDAYEAAMETGDFSKAPRSPYGY